MIVLWLHFTITYMENLFFCLNCTRLPIYFYNVLSNNIWDMDVRVRSELLDESFYKERKSPIIGLPGRRCLCYCWKNSGVQTFRHSGTEKFVGFCAA